LEEGVVALDTPVELPRPRRRGSVELALLEERLLKRLLKQEARQPEYVI
jgi:sulfonate transport system ATP-binding protein